MIPPTLSLSGFRTNAPGDFEAFVAVLRNFTTRATFRKTRAKKKETTSSRAIAQLSSRASCPSERGALLFDEVWRGRLANWMNHPVHGWFKRENRCPVYPSSGRTPRFEATFQDWKKIIILLSEIRRTDGYSLKTLCPDIRLKACLWSNEIIVETEFCERGGRRRFRVHDYSERGMIHKYVCPCFKSESVRNIYSACLTANMKFIRSYKTRINFALELFPTLFDL